MYLYYYTVVISQESETVASPHTTIIYTIIYIVLECGGRSKEVQGVLIYKINGHYTPNNFPNKRSCL